MIKIYLFVINWLSFSEQALSSHLHSIRFIILFTPANASVFFLTDALDRKTANDMRLRHHSGEITSVNSFTMLTLTVLCPRASQSCNFRRSLSAKASHNVLVVDRHVYVPWRFHATDPLDRHAPAP